MSTSITITHDASTRPNPPMRGGEWPDLAHRLPSILALLRGVIQEPTAVGTLQVVLRYVAQAGASITEAELRQAVTVALSDAGGDRMTTIADQWVARGIEQGVAQGIEQGIEQGVAQGVAQGLAEAIELALRQRFAEDPAGVDRLMADLRDVTNAATLREVLRAIVAGKAFDEVRRILA